jgi:branched-chain amino acid transport system ATP-binding protein
MLEVEGITAGYGPIMVLRDLHLTVPDGGSVCMLGPNGAGKTTTLRAIVGLIRPVRGVIRFDGERLDRLAPDRVVRRGVAMVPERREIFPYLSVLENLRLGAYTRGKDPQVKDDLERVFTLFPRLNERLAQAAGTLSGGEQQMLAIARALMTHPRLLLLDEPSLGLAPLLVREMFRSVASIRAQGTTLLIVEQNAHMALSVTDYGYVIESGRVVLEGSSEELRRREDLSGVYLGQV